MPKEQDPNRRKAPANRGGNGNRPENANGAGGGRRPGPRNRPQSGQRPANPNRSETDVRPEQKNRPAGSGRPANANRAQRGIQPEQKNHPSGAGQAETTNRADHTPRPEGRNPNENKNRRPSYNRRGPAGQKQQPSGHKNPKGGQRQPNNRGQNNASNNFAPSVPRKARGGIKARSEGGEFGKNWWAKRWLAAMERLMDGARLQRGRRYARMGQVLSMSETNEGVVARVQGSRPAPYKVTIKVTPLSDEQWEKVLDVLADQAIFTAQLLAGEMPPNIEETFAAADVSLFPARGGDLLTECSCPDWANPCKHIAATQYILGDRFDEDPFLIFRLRGRSQEQILQALRQRRAGLDMVEEEEPQVLEEVSPLDADLEHFWEIGPGLEDFAVNVQRSAIPLPLLKRLGEPDFARRYSLEDQLGPAYESISQAALILAFSDIGREPPENGSEPS